MSTTIDTIENIKIEDTENEITVIQNTLSYELLQDAIRLSKEAFEASRIEKDIATAIKQAFDAKIFGSTWHCIVGKHFAVSVQFDTQYFTFFKVDQHFVMLFKSEN